MQNKRVQMFLNIHKPSVIMRAIENAPKDSVGFNMAMEYVRFNKNESVFQVYTTVDDRSKARYWFDYYGDILLFDLIGTFAA